MSTTLLVRIHRIATSFTEAPSGEDVYVVIRRVAGGDGCDAAHALLAHEEAGALLLLPLPTLLSLPVARLLLPQQPLLLSREQELSSVVTRAEVVLSEGHPGAQKSIPFFPT